MKRLFAICGVLLAAIFAVLCFNAWRAQPEAVAVEPYRPPLDETALARRLAAAIAIPTLGAGKDEPVPESFAQLRALLEQAFPRLHATLSRELVNDGALLYRWEGRADCPPLVLAAHQDVVPVEPGTGSEWRHPAFAGVVEDGYIWGRGAVDDKASMMAIMEAVEHLLGEGFVPECPVYLAFGHDEETGGERGAMSLAQRLHDRGVVPAFVLDEGGALTQGTIAGLAIPVATIGVAEKGYVSLRLRARGAGGHSSMPPRATAIGILAAAVARLEERRPAPELGEVQRELLRRIAAHQSFGQRLVLANLWLTAPLVKTMLARTPATDATLRTTTAPTVFQAGVKDNVLAQQAEAVVNFRIRPGDSIDGVLAHARATIDDPRITIEVEEGFATEPTPPAPWDGPAFAAIAQALRSVSEEQIVVAPYVTSGATDARYYAILTPALYRFTPFKLLPDDLAGFHGTDERIAIAEYARGVRFYQALLRGFAAVAKKPLSPARAG